MLLKPEWTVSNHGTLAGGSKLCWCLSRVERLQGKKPLPEGSKKMQVGLGIDSSSLASWSYNFAGYDDSA